MTITKNPLSAQSENQADYKVVKAADLISAIQKQHEDEVIANALVILDKRMVIQTSNQHQHTRARLRLHR